MDKRDLNSQIFEKESDVPGGQKYPSGPVQDIHWDREN
jgi:hypothetical protein